MKEIIHFQPKVKSSYVCVNGLENPEVVVDGLLSKGQSLHQV
jgi:hypothetical protein